VHSTLSVDSSLSLREICEIALEKKIDRVAVTNHLVPISSGSGRKIMWELTPPITIDAPPDLWKKHFEEFKAVREDFPQLTLAFGIEADFYAPILSELKALLEAVPFDFVLGSTHYLNKYCISFREACAAYLKENALETYLKHYFEMSREAAASGLFDSMAHLDYCLEAPAELGMKIELRDYEEFAKKSIDEIARRKMAIEVNSCGLRKAVKNTFPSFELLEYAYAAGVPAVTIGSDAHRAGEIDFGLREAVEVAKKAGFENAWFFVERKPVEIPLSSL